MKTLIVIIFAAALVTSCQSEPLPSPATNAVTTFNYAQAGLNDAVGWKVDYLLPAYTNAPYSSTNWTTYATGPIIPGQTNYSSTNILVPGCMAAAWATNSAGTNSPPSNLAIYAPDPILFNSPTLQLK